VGRAQPSAPPGCVFQGGGFPLLALFHLLSAFLSFLKDVAAAQGNVRASCTAGTQALQASRPRAAFYGGVSRHHSTKPSQIHPYRCPRHRDGQGCSLPRHNTAAWHLQAGRAAMPPSNGWASLRWVFGRTSGMRWSLRLAAASPQTLSLHRCREQQVACAWQCKRSGDSHLSPKIRIRREITNLIFTAPTECCKGQELSAASRPIHPPGLAASVAFVGTWKFPAFPKPVDNAASSSAAGGREHLKPRCWAWSSSPWGRAGLGVKKITGSSKST